MLGDLAEVAQINYRNITKDEAFSQALWLISGIAGLGAFSATLSLFGSYSLGTTFASAFGGTFTYGHLIGALAVVYNIYRGGIGLDRFKRMNAGKQAIVLAGLGLFFLTGWNTGLESWITSNDFYVLVALAVENAAYIIISELA